MKKSVCFLALIALLTVVLLFTSCTMGIKKPQKPTGNNSQEETQTDEPQTNVEEEDEEQGIPDEVLRQEEWIFTANTLEEAKDIYDDFLFLTIYEDNLVVTVTDDSGLLLTETIDGDKEHIVYSWGEEMFAAKDGENYITAVKDGNNRYYFTDEESYYDKTFAFFFYTDVFADLPEDAEISLTSRGVSSFTEYNVFLDATLTLSIRTDDATTLVCIEKRNNQVFRFKSVTMVDSGMFMINLAFKVKKTSVTMPDLTDWFNASAPLVASEWYVTGTVEGKACDELPMYFDYISGSYKTDYLNIVVGDSITVKNKNDAKVSYSQKVDEDYLAGYEKIVFEPDNESIYFEYDVDPDEIFD